MDVKVENLVLSSTPQSDISSRKNGDSRPMSCPIVLAADAGYSMPLATTLRSIAETNRRHWPLDVHVLSDGFSKDMERKVFESLPQGSATIRWLPIELGVFRDFPTLSHINSKLTFARLLIPKVFPDTVSRVLYLDADLLVLDDLIPVWKTDLRETVVGAVVDFLDVQLRHNQPALEDVPRVQEYFNAGVLFINLARWRQERISDKALAYLLEHPQTPFADQDALNVACDGLWTKLDSRWNFHDHCGKEILNMSSNQKPGIVHFIGRAKPWNYSILNVNAPLYDEFRSRTWFARTFEDKLWDMVQYSWVHLKAALRRYAFLRRAWKRIKPLMTT